MQQRLTVRLSIPNDQLIQYYEGHVNLVVAQTTDGRRVRFPANVLRSVVHPHGVYGQFELLFDENNKFISITRLGD